MIRILNQAYSDEFKEKRLMDIYIPEERWKGIGILFVHGGGFHGGNKEQWSSVAQYFCGLGYTCATAGYRLAPEWIFPAAVEDVYLAMDYFKKNAEGFKIYKNQFAAVGSSAGGYLAGMLATSSDDDAADLKLEINAVGLTSIKPDALVLYCPVTTVHFTPEFWGGRDHGPDFVEEFMGQPEREVPDLYKTASPYNRINGSEPSMLCIHGDSDKDIPIQHSELLCKKVKEFGGKADLIKLPGVKHGFGYGVDTEAQKASLKHVRDFLGERFGG